MRKQTHKESASDTYVVIDAAKSTTLSFDEMMSYKDVFYFLVWRDILIRYKQTVLGVLWVIIRPLLTMGVFTLLFGRIAGFATQAVPYPVIVFSGLLPWQFFADSFFFGATSLVGNVNMISKIYFPRIFIPASAVMCCVLDFGISLVLLLALMLWYGGLFSLKLFALPLFLAWNVLFTSALTAGVAALNVRYRDFRYIVAFAVQFGLYISPVGFSTSVVPLKWRLLYSLNPLVGIIDGFRWAIAGEQLYIPGLVASLVTTSICVVASLKYFVSAEKHFADVI